MKKPCTECPWRKDVTKEWPAERFLNLWNTCQNDGFAVMACHKSTEGEDVPCAGFVQVVRFDSIGLRLADLRGTIQIDDYTTDVPLYRSFDDMLEANQVPVPQRRYP